MTVPAETTLDETAVGRRRGWLATVLRTADPGEKAALARQLAAGDLAAPDPFVPDPWPRPARRDRPPLAAPHTLPKRGLGSPAGRIALLHAIAHIELNAIDLAADMAGRFFAAIPAPDRAAFVADWMSVMDDEARHFCLVAARLSALGAAYGDLPAHDGLFDAAVRTEEDVAARLAVAPLILEARGLDVTPGMIDRLERAGDAESAAVLRTIYTEEIGHVAIGVKWFRRVAAARDQEPGAYFRSLVGRFFPGGPKPPFNTEARARAGLPGSWYGNAA